MIKDCRKHNEAIFEQSNAPYIAQKPFDRMRHILHNPHMEVSYSSVASKKEVEGLPIDMRARFQRIIELMEIAGTHMIGMPYMRQIDGEIYEMRLRGVAGIARTIYVAVEKDELVILHSFIKKTQKTPQQAIELAKKRWRNYQ